MAWHYNFYFCDCLTKKKKVITIIIFLLFYDLLNFLFMNIMFHNETDDDEDEGGSGENESEDSAHSGNGDVETDDDDDDGKNSLKTKYSFIVCPNFILNNKCPIKGLMTSLVLQPIKMQYLT